MEQKGSGRGSSDGILELIAMAGALAIAFAIFLILVYSAVLLAIGAAIWFGHKLGMYQPSEHDPILKEIKRLNWAQKYHVNQLTEGKDESELDDETQQMVTVAKSFFEDQKMQQYKLKVNEPLIQINWVRLKQMFGGLKN